MSSMTMPFDVVPMTNSRRPSGGGFLRRTRMVCRAALENRGPIGTYSRSRSISSRMMNDSGDL